MHICFLCDEYPPGRHGGVGSFTQTLARAIAASRHTASVVGVYRGLDRTVVEDDRGVRVTRLPHSRLRRGAIVANSLLVRRAIDDIHRTHPIDVIEGPELAFVRLADHGPAVRVIRMNGGHHFFAVTLGGRPRFPRRWLEKLSFRRADRFCAVSRFVAETTRGLLGLGGVPIEVLPNPVDTATFCPRERTRERPDTILFVGTLCEKKGIRQLIQAMPAIVAAVPSAQLEVVGPDRVDPTTGQSFRELLDPLVTPALRPHVVFSGPVENHAIPDRIAAASVCVYPSHMEACPVAWLEAMAMRKAIVASATGPGPEILDDGVSGLLCDPHDPASIASRVIALLQDSDLRARLAAAAYRRVIELYAIDVIVERNVAFYQRCVEHARLDCEPLASLT
jgi:glycosyltransferase involved in cell wall biosynthesis